MSSRLASLQSLRQLISRHTQQIQLAPAATVAWSQRPRLSWTRVSTLIATFVAVAVLATGLIVVRGRAAGERFHWRAGLTKILASGSGTNASPSAPTLNPNPHPAPLGFMPGDSMIHRAGDLPSERKNGNQVVLDVPPSLSIDDVSQFEGNSGPTFFVFTVTRTGDTSAQTDVDFQTQDGTATVGGNDYQANSGTASFPVGFTAATITVVVNGDTTPESDETFTVNLSNPTLGVTISKAVGTGTIQDDDSATAADGTVNGSITDDQGRPVSGAVVRLSGAQSRKTITDANGNYQFDNVETSDFYTISPARANYNFNPGQRSFSVLGNRTEASFAGVFTGDSANPLDTAEYFVRQQYVDVLGREPDEGGFNYWSDQILACGNDATCMKARRISVAQAFFMSDEFQQSGSFIYESYAGALGRQPVYAEFSADRRQVVGGANLDVEKAAFAASFVERMEFVNKYEANLSAESFVDALLQAVQQNAGIDLSNQRDALIIRYKSGASLNDSRALVLSALADDAAFKRAEYNSAFVLTEYFGYLRRDLDQAGYDFWVNVLDDHDVGNYRGLVCSFVTSAEYQRRFSNVVLHNNTECGP
jgi:Calx-beta domain/Carboxypeptidase regulatory-like domain/Domain of unknown function (DUF4214)